jgi:hypothetical protein
MQLSIICLLRKDEKQPTKQALQTNTQMKRKIWEYQSMRMIDVDYRTNQSLLETRQNFSSKPVVGYGANNMVTGSGIRTSDLSVTNSAREPTALPGLTKYCTSHIVDHLYETFFLSSLLQLARKSEL